MVDIHKDMVFAPYKTEMIKAIDLKNNLDVLIAYRNSSASPTDVREALSFIDDSYGDTFKVLTNSVRVIINSSEDSSQSPSYAVAIKSIIDKLQAQGIIPR